MELISAYQKIHMKKGLSSETLQAYFKRITEHMPEERRVLMSPRRSGKSFYATKQMQEMMEFALDYHEGTVRGRGSEQISFNDSAIGQLMQEREDFERRRLTRQIELEENRVRNSYMPSLYANWGVDSSGHVHSIPSLAGE